MSSIPRLTLTLCDSYHGGFLSVKPATVSPGLPSGVLNRAFIYKRWLDASDRFSFTNPIDNTGAFGVWEPVTDVQNIQGRGANMSYAALYQDQLNKANRQPRYNVFLSSSASGIFRIGGNRPLASWNTGFVDGSLQLYLQKYLRPALANLRRPIEFGGLYFSIGGNDAKLDPLYFGSEEYIELLEDLFEVLEAELGITQIPAVGNLVPGDLDLETYPSRDAVRRQQTLISELSTGPLANTVFYDSTGAATVDGLHLTHEAVLSTGIALNDLMLTVNPLGSEPIIN